MCTCESEYRRLGVGKAVVEARFLLLIALGQASTRDRLCVIPGPNNIHRCAHGSA